MQATAKKTANDIGYCTFFLGEKRYAIDILTVQEINRQFTITKAHGAPPFICGLQNLRGQIVTVIDTRLTLGMPSSDYPESSCILILKTNEDFARRGLHHLKTSDDLIGLLVDDVSDVIRVEASDIEPVPAGGEIQSTAVSGVIRLDSEVLRVVQPHHLLDSEEGVE